MRRRLILVRHAKSNWDEPSLEDIARPLNARGARNAVTMGRWLKERGFLPDLMIVSPARRTQETAAGLAEGMGVSGETEVDEDLYLAPEDRILSAVKRARGDTVLLIAHNPGISVFATHFARAPHPHPDFRRYPTCATTVFALGADDWRNAEFGHNEVLDFAVPREVEATE
ncbi:SixA phosphatase family protein [Celeribacter indicus]|uniref:Phosphoglycerate mutase n=1 Tax=Celeribacter indicus TaxID=1208324 RepID=A0A0B5DW72_9RHOB|nr:histidine phosphatase family protein [Celeribacter indicus]AJE45405.1 phosphoglycerate mutase [Celeribacter indicus]SDX01112.1 phosphohistidine phosphatase [Celeribacter indicus]